MAAAEVAVEQATPAADTDVDASSGADAAGSGEAAASDATGIDITI